MDIRNIVIFKLSEKCLVSKHSFHLNIRTAVYSLYRFIHISSETFRFLSFATRWIIENFLWIIQRGLLASFKVILQLQMLNSLLLLVICKIGLIDLICLVSGVSVKIWRCDHYRTLWVDWISLLMLRRLSRLLRCLN